MIKRMTWTTRLQIEKLFNSGASYRQIARYISFSVSSVYAEIQRGLYDHLDGATWETVKRYSAQIADDDASWQATSRGCPVKLGKNHVYASLVSVRIRAGESPDQIVGDLRRRGEWTVSTTTLYRYIDQGYIPGVTNADLLQKSRKKRPYHKVQKAARPSKGPSIEARPQDVDQRQSFGHWEMDSVIGKAKGKNQSVLTLVERVSRYQLIFKLSSKSSAAVVRALSKAVCHFPAGTFQTITVDNGSEFQDYEGLKSLAQEIYYCHPYSSFERGSNENANRIIRRFFPKGQSLRDRTQRDCDAAADAMNRMHRKILGYATPKEIFDEWQAQLRAAQSS